METISEYFAEHYKGKQIGRKTAKELATAGAALNGVVSPSHLLFAIEVAYGSGGRYPKASKLSVAELFRRIADITEGE